MTRIIKPVMNRDRWRRQSWRHWSGWQHRHTGHREWHHHSKWHD